MSKKCLTLTMTNDPSDNCIKVYDFKSQILLQTVRTHGKGGVSGNGFGIRQYNNKLVGVVNYGSKSVTLFKREDNKLIFKKKVYTTSAPVSIDFGYDHMYVAGDTTVDSFSLDNFEKDGTARLILIEGTIPNPGSTAQIGVLRDKLLVTLKTDPNPGTINIIPLREDGSVSKKVKAVGAPPNTLTPFGFNVMEDGTALITLAHSNNIGLFRDNKFVDVISISQNAPCWATSIDKYIFTVNTGSKTVTRYVSTGQNIFVDGIVATSLFPTGNPTDAYQNNGYLAIIDHSNTTSHLNFFSVNEFGEITSNGDSVDIDVPNANGVTILVPEF